MRTRIAALVALLAVLLSTTPANTVTKGGVPDAGEHPMVGQLVFYVPDALPSPYGADQPGGWFSCSGTLLSGTVVVTAGHCTFAIGLDSVSTRRRKTASPPKTAMALAATTSGSA